MADQPKKKPLSQKTRNEDRRNKKAFKQKPTDFRGRKEWRGNHTRHVALTPVQKLLINGGGPIDRLRKPLD